MAIRAGVCGSYLAEIPKGIHEEGDEYFVALYNEAADLSPMTTRYKPNNESRGMGYKPGGKALTGFDVSLHGCCACVSFDSPKWDLVTLSAYGGLIYNKSKGNRAVAVFSFDELVSSTNAPLTANFPAAGEHALIRIEG